ncbi:MAG: GNAT family N-acetyltransferase [Gemmatimonadaceae bacterium]
MNVRPVRHDERAEYQRMRLALWPDSSDADNDSWFARDDAATFVAEYPNGSLCGFVEVGSRPYAEGCDSSPVGFIEGWWVAEDVRRTGVGRALLAAAETWARSKGYTEMGSDALLDNHTSHAAHGRCGYSEVERQVMFRKSLAAS